MNTIILISIYSLLLLCLFTFIFLRAREEIIGLRKKYQGIVGSMPKRNVSVEKEGKKENYDRSIQEMLNERKKDKNYISESIAA
jgi:hypothetical protein